MQAHRAAETTPLDRVLTRHPPSTTLTETSDRPGTPVSDERLTPVQYRRAGVRRLYHAMESARHKQTAAKRRHKEEFDKAVRFQIEERPSDQVYSALTTHHEAQGSESETTAPLTRYSKIWKKRLQKGAVSCHPARPVHIHYSR